MNTTSPSTPSENHTISAHDQAVLLFGQDIWERMKGETPGVFNKDYWQGRILEWAMKDPSFKIDMFRFVDVLPVLQDKEQVARHIKEYLLQEDRELPMVIKTALKAASGGITAGLGAMAIKKNVTDMANRFIVGEDAKSAVGVLKKLHKEGIAFTVDLLGEATVSEVEADAYAARYLDLIENLSSTVDRFSPDSVIDENHMGPIPRTNVSLKISAMYSQIDPMDPVGSVAQLKKRVLPLFLAAKEKNVFINVDLEQWAVHEITFLLFEEILSHPELRNWPHLGIVVQAYLKSAMQDTERLLSLAKNRGAPITIRLVKGAYWDYETVVAKQKGWEIPVFQNKAETDISYENIARFMLTNIEHLCPAFGSHNLRSLSNAMVLMRDMKVPEKSCEIQMLYGMAEPERRVFRSLGHRVRVYAPVGEMLPGMAYLVRRLLENTSNSGFLKLSHHDGAEQEVLLQAPQVEISRDASGNEDKSGEKTTSLPNEPIADFQNCALTDFTRADRLTSFQEATRTVKETLPLRVPIAISANEVFSSKQQDRYCPSETSRLVTQFALADANHAEEAIRVAKEAFPLWRDTSLQQRCAHVIKLADLLERDRDQLAAIQSFEVGKPWKEADGDVAEAVDFCRYYAHRAQIELGERMQGSLEGEDNRLWYEGRGPTVVIAPWNFPLAILCGMSTAALIAGNPIIMKPAEQSTGVAWGLYEKMMEAGFPKGTVGFLPGIGEEIGPTLVNHLDTAQIAFTGSRPVGLSIIKDAGETKPNQTEVKRVVCEMGGKNATIIDDDADLDEAVLGVIHGAFGFSGQKCSACSRVLVVEPLGDIFIERLVEATKSILMGPAHDPSFHLGPVVDEEAHQRLQDLIASPGPNVKTWYTGTAPQDGHYIAPAIFEVDDPKHHLMQAEFFGPVLTIMRVKSFDQAIEYANQTEFALTGAVFSRSPTHLEQAKRQFRVGNLYLNRESTGALVHRQPFGGFGMSGIGTKAGGPGYLKHFANPRCVTENTMRRGFTPELES
jgi:RHH-type transcriptional regulator, proline utilization regulon repressor / proline dehydrogenase / delta 1-pyrroline-5-carboxylate dehydrogenase